MVVGKLARTISGLALCACAGGASDSAPDSANSRSAFGAMSTSPSCKARGTSPLESSSTARRFER